MKKAFLYFFYGIVFVLFFSFAIQNTTSVTLAWRPVFSWEAPLVLIVSVFLACGIFLGYLMALGLLRISRRKNLKTDSKKQNNYEKVKK